MVYGTSPYDGGYQRLLPVIDKGTEEQLSHTNHLFKLLNTPNIARRALEH
jgi:hypothetical protein